MLRRTFVALSLGSVLLPALARADVAPSPPPPLDVRERSTTHRGEGSPRAAAFELVSRGSAAMRVRVEGLVALLPGMRLPLTIESVRLDGRAAGREITLAPGRTAVLEVAFAAFEEVGPPARAWRFELRARVEHGEPFPGLASGTTLVRRG
jgi:hypothetical protein